jgi:hypothetical protein
VFAERTLGIVEAVGETWLETFGVADNAAAGGEPEYIGEATGEFASPKGA